jgi:DNA-binding NtrC family response regulator
VTSIINKILSIEIPPHGINENALLKLLESHLIYEALKRTRGNLTHAANLLGLKRTTLLMKLKSLGGVNVREESNIQGEKSHRKKIGKALQTRDIYREALCPNRH